MHVVLRPVLHTMTKSCVLLSAPWLASSCMAYERDKADNTPFSVLQAVHISNYISQCSSGIKAKHQYRMTGEESNLPDSLYIMTVIDLSNKSDIKAAMHKPQIDKCHSSCISTPPSSTEFDPACAGSLLNCIAQATEGPGCSPVHSCADAMQLAQGSEWGLPAHRTTLACHSLHAHSCR